MVSVESITPSGWLHVRFNTEGSYRGNGGSLTTRNRQENDGTSGSIRGVKVQNYLSKYAEKANKSRDESRLFIIKDDIRLANPAGTSRICLAQ